MNNVKITQRPWYHLQESLSEGTHFPELDGDPARVLTTNPAGLEALIQQLQQAQHKSVGQDYRMNIPTLKREDELPFHTIHLAKQRPELSVDPTEWLWVIGLVTVVSLSLIGFYSVLITLA